MTGSADRDDKPAPAYRPAIDDYLLLVGHPPADDFFRFFRTRVVGGETADTDDLIRAWRKANARVRELRDSEATLADGTELRQLPTEMRDAAAAALREAEQRGYRLTPCRWMHVELDRMTVFQKRINLRWVSQLQALIGKTPTARDLVEVASGARIPKPHIKVVRSDEGTYTLSCSSGELRFLGPRTLDPGEMPDLGIPGEMTNVIGLFIGFGFSFLSALNYRDRLILKNGTHRAYALRALGFERVPCLVTEIDHEDDLDLAGIRGVRPQIERSLRLPRPPLFKDYFDPALGKVVPVSRSDHALHLEVVARSIRVPAAQ